MTQETRINDTEENYQQKHLVDGSPSADQDNPAEFRLKNLNTPATNNMDPRCSLDQISDQENPEENCEQNVPFYDLSEVQMIDLCTKTHESFK